MSSTTNHSDAETGNGRRVITILFTVSVIFFLLGGLAIVIGQAATLAAGDATAARHWETALTPYAFGGASVAGLLAFVLSYWHKESHDEDDPEEAAAVVAAHTRNATA